MPEMKHGAFFARDCGRCILDGLSQRGLNCQLALAHRDVLMQEVLKPGDSACVWKLTFAVPHSGLRWMYTSLNRPSATKDDR